MSVIEIYLEKIIDLLDTSPQQYKPSSQQEMLKIREDQSGGVYLEGETNNAVKILFLVYFILPRPIILKLNTHHFFIHIKCRCG